MVIVKINIIVHILGGDKMPIGKNKHYKPCCPHCGKVINFVINGLPEKKLPDKCDKNETM